MLKHRILPIPMGVLPESYAVAINMSLDENYILSAQLVDQKGNAMGTAQLVDLPLESVIVSGRYDDNTQSLILVLDNGKEITIPVSGLIAGLQEEITAQNPLSADLLTDGTNNKVFTAAEQTKLSNIAAGAEVNVQANWNEIDSSSDSYIQNKPTLGTMAAENASDYTPTSSLATVATTGDYDDLSNTPTLGTMAAENASDYTPTSSLSSVALSGSYTDLSNTPTIPAAQVNSDWNASSGVAEILNKPTIPTVNDATITLQDGNGTALGSFTTNDANNQTITIPAGGGGNEWFGTQAQFDALSSYDADTDYFISDNIDYNTDIKNKPNLSVYATQYSLNQTNGEVVKKMEGKFLTEQEFTDLQNKQEGVNYFIEGTTIQMVITFTDQSTATYNVVVD